MHTRADLPHPMTRLIGRERQVKEILDLLQGSRLLTLTGPGGIGKTHLALHVARETANLFPDGVHYLSLVTIPDAERVIPSIAHSLQLPELSNQSNLEQLIEALSDQQMLLVLDNFEQVIEAAPSILALLAATRLRIMITSRIVLRIPGEQEYPVPPLELPPATHTGGFEALLGNPSIQLFVARARSVRHDFLVNEETIAHIGEICRYLEGIPLAIELAAARSKILAPSALVQRLNQRLSLLSITAPSVAERHQSLRAMINWSYDLLTEQEQQLFRWTAICINGFSLEAAGALCLWPDFANHTILLDLLESLIDKSLLQQVSATDEPRFSYLETIREYAWEQAIAHQETAALRQRHADFFTQFAAQAAQGLRGPEQKIWMARLTLEHDNLRAVLRWAQSQHNYVTMLQISAALWRYWLYRGHIHEGRQWLDATFAILPDSLRETDPEIEDTLAQALNGAGNLARELRQYATAYELCHQVLEIYRRRNDQHGIAAALGTLGIIAHDQGDIQTATGLYEESLAISRTLNDPRSIAIGLNNLGILAEQSQDYGRAQALYAESTTYYEAAGNVYGKALCLNNIGVLYQRQANYAAAQSFHLQSLALMHELENTLGIGSALADLTHVSMATHRITTSVRIIAALTLLYDSMGQPKSWDIDDLAAYLDTARKQLDPAIFNQAWEEGQRSSLDEIVLEMLASPPDLTSEPSKPSQPKPPVGTLTLREQEVLELMVSGLTNKEIAAKLVISVYTVGDHVGAIFRKLGVSTRSAATRLALEHGLVNQKHE